MTANRIITTVEVPEFDVVRMGDEKQSAILKITVDKAYNGGAIEVSAVIGGSGEGFFTFMMFADFSATLVSIPAKRVTKKAIQKLHDERVNDDLIAEAKQLAVAHYANQMNVRASRDGHEMTDEQRAFFADRHIESQAA